MNLKLLIAVILLLSSIATGPTAADDTANVYVFRPDVWFGKVLGSKLYVDGREVARLSPGEYVKLALPAGQHRLQGHKKKFPLDIAVSPGEDYFLRITIQDRDPDTGKQLWKGTGMLLVLDHDQAMFDLRFFQPKPTSRISDNSLVISDPSAPEHWPQLPPGERSYLVANWLVSIDEFEAPPVQKAVLEIPPGLHKAIVHYAWGGGASWLSNRNFLTGVLWPTPIELEFDAEPGHRYCIEVDVRAQSYTAQIEPCDK